MEALTPQDVLNGAVPGIVEVSESPTHVEQGENEGEARQDERQNDKNIRHARVAGAKHGEVTVLIVLGPRDQLRSPDDQPEQDNAKNQGRENILPALHVLLTNVSLPALLSDRPGDLGELLGELVDIHRYAVQKCPHAALLLPLDQ